MTSHVPNEARVIPLRPRAERPAARPAASPVAPVSPERRPPTVREPLWRDLVGDVLRRDALSRSAP
ncbi:hypothetical protein RKD29_000686 [Streptomyces tendae]